VAEITRLNPGDVEGASSGRSIKRPRAAGADWLLRMYAA
jgi:hypothetical protein